MNTVHDAYQPPIVPGKKSSMAWRLILIGTILVVALTAMAYTGLRMTQQAQQNDWNMNRAPVRERLIEAAPEVSETMSPSAR